MLRVNRVGFALLAAALWASSPMQAQDREGISPCPIAANSSPAAEVPFQLRFLAPPQELRPPQTAERLPAQAFAKADRRKTLSDPAVDRAESSAETSTVRATKDLDRASAKAVFVNRFSHETQATHQVPTRPLAWTTTGSPPAATTPQPATWNPTSAIPPPSNWGPGSAVARTPTTRGTLSQRPPQLPATSQPLSRPSARPLASPRPPANPAIRSSGSWGSNLTATVPAPSWGTAARPASPQNASPMTPGWSNRPAGSRGRHMPLLNPTSPPVRRR
jgi:hypothetical protein